MFRRILVAVLATGLMTTAAHARRTAIDHCSGRLCYQAKVRTSCLKPGTWALMHAITRRVGPIEVTSACDGRHARHSQHYAGKAIDFRPLNASPSAAVAALRGMPQVGGIGSYGNGLVHADIGARKMSWYRPGARSRYARRHRTFTRYAARRSAYQRVAYGRSGRSYRY